MSLGSDMLRDGRPAPPVVPAPIQRGLVESDFRLLSANGFGNGYNAYAHSMAWFEGKLYVGTTLGPMQQLKTYNPAPNMKPWPVVSSMDIYDVDRRGEIWCLDPATWRWQRVYKAPWVEGLDGRPTPRYMSFRGMTVFKDGGTPSHVSTSPRGRLTAPFHHPTF